MYVCGAESITGFEVYQVVYSLETKYFMCENWWQIWYLLQCPFLGIDSLKEAH